MFAFLLSMYPGVDLVVRTILRKLRGEASKIIRTLCFILKEGLVESQELLNKKVLGKESTCHIEKQ